ncbi:MAG: alpha/beta hydrolase [Chitinispirillaceae bacterium]|nr:alpha/beta hydrolase [Chitinispirillaceae bacterium]
MIAFFFSMLSGQSPTYTGLSYGPASTNKLDLYIPTSGTKPFPIVVWIHGGAWMSGTRDDPLARDLFNIVGPKGIAVASIDHTMSSGAKWPVQSQECRAVIRWVRANASQYNLDPDRIGTGGMSSGGHLAAFLGTSGDVTTATSGSVTMDLEGTIGGNTGYSSRVQAVLDMYGPTDFLTMSAPCPGNNPQVSTMDHDAANSPESSLIGGAIQQNRDKCALANPIHFVTGDDPPFLMLHGTNDALVPSCQSRKLDSALAKAFAANNKEHSLYLLSQGHGFSPNVQRDTVLAFFTRYLLNQTATEKPLVLRTRANTSMVQVHGTRLVAAGKEPLIVSFFDLGGRGRAVKHLRTGDVVDLASFGSGVRVCQVTIGKEHAFQYTVVCP